MNAHRRSRFLAAAIVCLAAAAATSVLCRAQQPAPAASGEDDWADAKSAVKAGAGAIDKKISGLDEKKKVLQELINQLEQAPDDGPSPTAAPPPAAQVSATIAPPKSEVIKDYKQQMTWYDQYKQQALQAKQQALQATDPNVARYYIKEAFSKADNAGSIVNRMSGAVGRSVEPAADTPAADVPAPHRIRPLEYDDSSYPFRQLLKSSGLGEAYIGRAGIGEAAGMTSDPIDLRPAGTPTLVSDGGVAVNIAPAVNAAADAAPAGATPPPLFKPVPSPSSAGPRYSVTPEGLQALRGPATSELRNQPTPGGVALDVTLDLLAFAGVPGFRNGGPAIVVESPVVVSLAELHRRLAPFAENEARWNDLPEDLRYPGGLERVFGFVLDPRTDDLFLVGGAARDPADRIDVDLLIVALQSVWRDGGVPTVSLDPAADEPTGPVYARVVGLPPDCSAAKLMLEADYAMKRISLGDLAVDVPGFQSVVELLAGQDRKPAMTRSWFSPVPFAAKDIHISTTSRTLLFNSRIEVLDEGRLFLAGAAVDSGPPDEAVVTSDRLFTEHYDAIARSPNVEPAGVFLRLRGLVDLVSVCKLLRVTEVDYPVLREFAALPFRHLAGAEAAPATYPSLVKEYARTPVDGQYRVRYLAGGVQLKPRANRRSIDLYQDAATTALEAAVDAFPRESAFAVSLATELLVPAPQTGEAGGVESKIAAGRAALVAGEFENARRLFRELTDDDPLIAEGWANLALAQAALDDFPAAIEAVRQALLQDPSDDDFREIALLVLQLAGAEFDPRMLGDAVRRQLSDELCWRGFNAVVAERNESGRNLLDLALKLRDDNPDAFYFRSLSWEAFSPPWKRDVDRAVDLYREQLRRGDRHGRDRLALALAFRAQSQLAAAAQLDDADLSNPAKLRDVFDALDRGVADAVEARRLRESLPLAPTVEGELRTQQASLRLAVGADSDYRPARRLLDQVVARFPDYAPGRRALAAVLAQQDDLDGALREMSAAIRLAPTLHGALCERAALYALRKDYAAAEADLAKARQLGLPIPPEIEQLVGSRE
ncbi:MAG: hypothetical protein JNL96_02575 [Planctomycetaceae bacterium]|nr:hypothetical protein [Planctomycetaceae bacterium]